MKMSKRAYARHRGCSDTAVRKAVIEGRISADADGQIDVGEADRFWPRHDAGAKPAVANQSANPGASSQEVRTAANAKLVRQVLDEEGQDLGGDEGLIGTVWNDDGEVDLDSGEQIKAPTKKSSWFANLAVKTDIAAQVEPLLTRGRAFRPDDRRRYRPRLGLTLSPNTASATAAESGLFHAR